MKPAHVGLMMILLILARPESQAATPLPINTSLPTTEIIVVRHAERQQDGTDDPGLDATGWARAHALAEALSAWPVAAIYTSQLTRTLETAVPLSTRQGLSPRVRTIHPGRIEEHVEQLVAELLVAHAGETVVVIGHSNTVPLIVAALSGRAQAAMSERDYDHFYLVRSGPGTAGQVLAVRYGAPSPTAFGKTLEDGP